MWWRLDATTTKNFGFAQVSGPSPASPKVDTHIPVWEFLLEGSFHVTHFLLQDMLILSFRYAVAEIVDMIRWDAIVYVLDPVADKRHHHAVDVGSRDDLHSTTIRFASCGISDSEA